MAEESVYLNMTTDFSGYGRVCAVCKQDFPLLGFKDPSTICPDCYKAINELVSSRKRNWTPDSKGGEPNCRREK